MSKENKIRCKFCDNLNDEENIFCDNCGSLLKIQTQVTQEDNTSKLDTTQQVETFLNPELNKQHIDDNWQLQRQENRLRNARTLAIISSVFFVFAIIIFSLPHLSILDQLGGYTGLGGLIIGVVAIVLKPRLRINIIIIALFVLTIVSFVIFQIFIYDTYHLL